MHVRVVETELHDPPALLEELLPFGPVVHLHGEGELHLLQLGGAPRQRHMVDLAAPTGEEEGPPVLGGLEVSEGAPRHPPGLTTDEGDGE